MATRSTIGIQYSDGVIFSNYCHNDGYLSGNGQFLYRHYKEVEKVKELIKLGKMSSLDKEISPPPKTKHTFDNPVPGVCVVYHRDRGQLYCHPEKFNSLQEYLESETVDGYGYNYLFKIMTKEWYIVNKQTKKLEKLSSALLKDKSVQPFIKQLIKSEVSAKKLEIFLPKKEEVKITKLKI